MIPRYFPRSPACAGFRHRQSEPADLHTHRPPPPAQTQSDKGYPGVLYCVERKTMDSARRQAKSELVRATRQAYRAHPIPKPTSVNSRWERDDFIWDALLLSFSTWGGSRGNELRNDPQVTFDALSACGNARQREKRMSEALVAAGVRWATKKTPLLLENFQMIVDRGGPSSVKRKLNLEKGCNAKIKFLRTFRGVGPKYARNMMMDVYHPDFWESIAVDTRVQHVLDALGLPFRDYDEKEKFLLEVAHEAGLNGWQLDRLIYNSNDAVLAALSEERRT